MLRDGAGESGRDRHSVPGLRADARLTHPHPLPTCQADTQQGLGQGQAQAPAQGPAGGLGVYNPAALP